MTLDRYAGVAHAGITAAAAVLAAAVLAGCGDDDPSCGPGAIADDGITAAVAATDAAPAVQVAWAELVASANNDCPPPGGAGMGAISITIEGVQREPAGQATFSLCLPRPDELGAAPISLADDDLVQIVNTSAELADGCRLRFDRSADAALPTGTITFTGFCADGTDPAGFALAIDGEIALERICDGDGGEVIEPTTAQLGGRAVATPP